jgi:agmatine/peptidylarginine deiminase
MRRSILLAVCVLVLGLVVGGRAMSSPPSSGEDLIILAAPRADDAYYRDHAEAIFAFQVAFARQIAAKDRVIVLTDAASYPRYAEALGANRVAVAPMDDIWARDYGLSITEQPVLFRYTAAGQGGGVRGQRESDAVQRRLTRLATAAKLGFRRSTLLNDGGNIVEDYAGSAVVSRKFLRDNRLSEPEGRKRLQALGVRHVAFIEADEQGGLEHADGVVSFVDVNTLAINAYPEDPAYAAQLRADLRRGLPGVVLHEIVTPYDGRAIADARFGSACGLYTNALATRSRIYLPQFGIPEDAIALRQVRAATRREVIPVRSEGVCRMGGGVRCLSWQLSGDNAAALLQHLGKTGR